jgi:hypothetical protein
LDITDPKRLRLRQKAVLKNELEPFSDAEIFLISGFPSVQFSHVTSPLSLGTTWAGFFEQLGQQIRPGTASGVHVARQQLVMHNAPPPAAMNIDLSALPAGEGVDLHHHSIGRRTMDEGDSLAVDLASAEAKYDRVVEWLIPDTRQPNGRYIEEHERRQNPDRYNDSPWDAVRFRNPFDFPMTTGPAMVVAAGKFNGQRMSSWVNRGEKTSLRVTKSLSIRTRHLEKEMPGEREIVHIGGRTFRKAGLVGEAYANNHRNEDVTLVVRRQFSGKLLAADGNPKKDVLETGAYSVNERHELTWEVKLKPGEELKLTYRYEVLVYH